MQIEKTKFKDVFLISADVYEDKRGFFVKSFSQELSVNNNIDFTMSENFYSYSKENVIRGMHFQENPYAQKKIVYVVNGKILDVIIDLRIDSPTYLQYESFILSVDNKKILYIPEGFAHGFKVIGKDALVMYMCSQKYNREYDKGIRWDSFGFDWGADKPIISERDSTFVELKNYKSDFKVNG